MVRHGLPNLKASFAAAVALSTSALSASATSQIFSPVAGWMVGNVFPLVESCHSLLINNLVYLTSGGEEEEERKEELVVAILLAMIHRENT